LKLFVPKRRRRFAEGTWLTNARFYYVDERTPSGDAVYGDIDGEAHATHILDLAEHNKQEPPLQTFVKGKGYVKFEK